MFLREDSHFAQKNAVKQNKLNEQSFFFFAQRAVCKKKKENKAQQGSRS
jgi:hypothetical protein